ncbi:hypothetical protein [Actinosynnema sp. NPDC020468]|uniref:hypothetical protein n=1 Tax=Actinosynnema sp. NPDC020468 TaxID=3154488 RepID=UPI0033C687F5
MPWVERHRRRTPYSWFQRTTVRSHYRRPAGRIPILPIAIALVVIVVLIAIF